MINTSFSRLSRIICRFHLLALCIHRSIWVKKTTSSWFYAWHWRKALEVNITKGYNESSCLPFFREVKHEDTKITNWEKENEKPRDELKRMPWARPAIYSFLLVHRHSRRSPRRSCRTVRSVNRNHPKKSVQRNRKCVFKRSFLCEHKLHCKTGGL